MAFSWRKRLAAGGVLAGLGWFGIRNGFSWAGAVHGYAADYVHPVVFAPAGLFAILGAVLLVPRATRRAGRFCLLAALILIGSYIGTMHALYRTGRVGWSKGEEKVSIEPAGDRLVIRFGSSASKLDVNRIWDEGLSLPATPRGRPLREGIKRVWFTYLGTVVGQDATRADRGLKVELAAAFPKAQREELIQRLRSMPGVSEVVFVAGATEGDPKPALR